MPRPPVTKRPAKRKNVPSDTASPDFDRSAPPALTPYILTNAWVERALLLGTETELLEDYFNKDRVGVMQGLARDASRAIRGGDRVFILPGIMGSTLGFPRDFPWDDVIWIDPFNILLGNLRKLVLDEGRNAAIEPLGVILFAYLSLKLRLRSSGFDAEFYPFDWRQDIAALGRGLAERLSEEKRPVHLVAHSMGGLVAQAALEHKPANLRRIITLGTPNFGSFAAIQAFRGVHPIARKIARLDLTSTQDEIGGIFKTFPGLCQMFPAVAQSGADYFALRSWPRSGVLPSEAMLNACRKTLAALPPAGAADLTQIIGCDRETVVAADIDDDEFVYTTSLEGDGTVPVTLALLPDRPAYFVTEEHGSLANNATVAKAVEDILTTGKTSRLIDQRPATRGDFLRRIPEHTLRDGQDAHDAEALGRMRRAAGSREARELLSEFASPPSPAASTPQSMAAPPLGAPPAQSAVLYDRVVIGRRHQLRLDITLAFGSITEVEASACVLGLFGQVSPGGAAKAIDALMDGAIMQMSERRMLSTKVGAVSFLPKGRHPVRADLIAFVGLGAFDSFKEETLEAATENLIRTLLLTRVDDFAMVPFGGGSGIDPGKALHHMMSGFTRGLVDADGDHRFRGITICELDPDRYRRIQHCLYSLCGTRLFDNVEVTLREKHLPAPRRMAVETAAAQPIYLIMRQEEEANNTALFISSLLTTGDKATTFPASRTVDLIELNRHLNKIKPGSNLSIPEIAAFGKTLGELVLSPEMLEVLRQYPSQHLVVVHDAGSSRIPWETLHIGDNPPALSGGLSHRYEAKDLSTTKWLQNRQLSRVLNILLIINPTGDLQGAEAEGQRIEKLFGAPGLAISVEPVRGEAARRSALLDALSSGKYDVVHYAGHAFFDADNPERSGILCAGGDVLAGSDLAALANLPSLMFFNACEAARIRRGVPAIKEQGGRAGAENTPAIPERLRRGIGFAEALLRGGVANYVGTYWPVGDEAAKAFAEAFYQSLLAGRTLGDAILHGRRALKQADLSDWADYVLYGDPGFILKPAAGTAR